MSKRERVYSLLKKVPSNKVTTYAELARAAGTHPRAVAVFMKTNRDPGKIECFRVVKSNGQVGGYSGHGGVRKKIELLIKCGIEVENGVVENKHVHRF
jgi:methylated-DNA-[protein]-cysteine S-methyltransferase